MTLLATLGVTAAAMTLVWLLSLRLRDASIVDIVWGLGFVGVAWTTFALTPDSAAPRRLLVCGMATAWGFRLAAYLAWRNVGKGEDYRYRALRAKYGSRFWIASLGLVFLLQGGLVWIISWPIQAVQWSAATAPLGFADALGIVMWATGLLFEAAADAQLARFKRQPDSAGRVMDRGLWRYSRHPNYFGDFLVWWGFGVMAVAAGAWWTLVGPVVMTVLLLKVSGVSLLESTIADRRPAYRDYALRTSPFFPRPPRR